MTGQHHYQARCSGSYISASIDTMPQTKQHYAHRMSVFACVLCEYEPFTSNCSRTFPRLHFLSGISFILSIPSILFFSLIYFSCEPAFFFSEPRFRQHSLYPPSHRGYLHIHISEVSNRIANGLKESDLPITPPLLQRGHCSSLPFKTHTSMAAGY